MASTRKTRGRSRKAAGPAAPCGSPPRRSRAPGSEPNPCAGRIPLRPASLPLAGSRLPTLVEGRNYDLAGIFERLNRGYFQGRVRAVLRWSSLPNRRVMGTWRKGRHGGLAVLTINRLLDQQDVPQHYVEFVVYHEMLHELLPAVRHRGQTVRHHDLFHRWEKRFERYEEAVRWEKSGLLELCRRLQAEPGGP